MRWTDAVVGLALLAACGGGASSRDDGGAGGAGYDGGGGGATGGAGSGGSAGIAGSGGAVGAGGAASCAAFTPCGGDLVGTWTMDAVCISAAQEYWASVLCDSAMATETATFGGTWTFRTDGTYQRDTVDSITTHFTAPPNCYGTTNTCEGLAAPDPSRGHDSASCSGTAVCTCTMTTNHTVSESGSYWFGSGASSQWLIATQPDGATSWADREICVVGNTLTMRTVTHSGEYTTIITAHR